MTKRPPSSHPPFVAVMKSDPRQRYIRSATIGYAVFAACWIFFSDGLLAAFVDISAIHWLSTAKGLLFVVVTTLLLFVALSGLPAKDDDRQAAPALTLLFTPPAWPRLWVYGFAVAVSLTMLAVRSGIEVSFGERPLLILFMFPVILSAMAGGLGPGLVSTATAALGVAYFVIPPVHSLLRTGDSSDLFQWGFFMVNGVLVSALSEVLHRLRRQTEVARQLQAVTLASIGDGVIATDAGGRITFMNHEALRLTGWTEIEAIGQPLSVVFMTVDEESRLPGEDPVSKAMAREPAAGMAKQALLISRDGRELPIQESYAPIRLGAGEVLGVVLVFRDDGERRRIEKAVQEERGLYLDLVNTQPAGIYRIRVGAGQQWDLDEGDPNREVPYRFEMVSDRFCQILGTSRQEFTDDPGLIVRRLHPEDRAGFASANQEASAKVTPFAWEGRMLVGGEARWVHFESLPRQLEKGDILWTGILYDITENKLAAEALRESEKTYRSLFDNALNSIVHARMIFAEGVPVDLEYLAVNPAFAKVTGITDEVVGRRINEVIAGYGEDNPESLAMFGRVAQSGEPARWEHYLAALDRWFSFAIYSPAPGEVVIVTDNISERKRAELALRQSEVRFRQLFAVVPVPLCFVTREGVIVDVNERFTETFGYSREELPDLNAWWRLAYPDPSYRLWVLTSWEAAVRRAAVEKSDIEPMEYRVTCKDGEVRTMLTSGITIGEDFLATFFDITVRQRIEQELRDSLAEKVVLLKEIHHRVKNNLQIVVSLLSLQADRMANPEAAAVLHDTQNRVRSMALLHESLYRSDNLARINLPAYIKDLCAQLLRAYGQTAARVRVEEQIAAIDLSMEQAVPCGLIVNELVSNALKHGFPDGRSGSIRVELGPDESRQLVLRVSDNGVGLGPGIDVAGTATLGLQLVRNLAGQLGGRLAVEGPPGGGVVFQVSCPFPKKIVSGGVS